MIQKLLDEAKRLRKLFEVWPSMTCLDHLSEVMLECKVTSGVLPW